MAQYEMDGMFIRTRDFTQDRYNLHHADGFVFDHVDADGTRVTEDDWLYNYEVISEFGEAAAAAYLDILYLDAICFNVDRHTKNYGILTDRDTGEIAGLAPNYDNNMAFYDFAGQKGKIGPLAARFRIFIRECGIRYQLPEATAAQIMNSLEGLEPPEGIEKSDVAQYVYSNMQHILGD